MKKLLAVAVLLAVSVPGFAQGKSNFKKSVTVVSYPVAHPVKTLKGFFYGLLVTVGSAADVVEKATALVAKGAAKADEGIDKIEPPLNPTN